jgi:hypothetical protein
MPITVDPDFLSQNREVFINTATRKFRIVIDTDVSPTQSPLSRIDSDGVSGQALYSFFKEEWKTDATLIPHPFPMIAITPEQFEFIEDWEPFNDITRKRIKTAGWREIDELDNLKKEYSGIITLGTFAESTDQAYYQQGTDTSDIGARVNFDRSDAVNEAILTYEEDVFAGSPGIIFTTNTIQRQDGGDFTAGTIPYQIGGRVTVLSSTDVGSPEGRNDGTYVITDVTASTLTVTGTPFIAGTSNTARLAKEFRNALSLFLREPYNVGFGTGKTFDQANLADIGVTTLTYQAYRFPLTNAADLKITNLDATIAARSPEVAITYYGSPQTFTGFVADAASTNSPQTEASFGIVIDAKGYTAEEVYEFIQYQLRQAADINDGGSPVTVIAGNIADELLGFVGDSLQTLSATNPLGGGTGVYIINFDSNDTNRLSFADNEFGTTSRRTFPFVAAGTINFNPNLVSDSMGMFWMFFEYTERFTGTVEISGAAGSSATIVMSGVALDTELAVSDYIAIGGLTNPENNGIWQVDTTPTTSPQSITATKINGDTVINEVGAGVENLDKNPIDSDDAIIVDSATTFSPLPITGMISGSSISFDFDYDGNVQGGRDSGQNAAIVLRAIGLETAQFVEATGTITRATGLSFTLTAGLERNYSNP